MDRMFISFNDSIARVKASIYNIILRLTLSDAKFM